jgi:hypothetical protein
MPAADIEEPRRPDTSWLRRILRYGATYGAPLGTIIAALWVATTWWADHQMKTEQAQRDLVKAQDIAKRDSQKPFLERQLQFYFEAVKVTAKLATLPPSLGDKGPGAEESYGWAYRRFWELYWGELAVVESQEIAGAMVRFGRSLEDLTTCRSTPDAACGDKQALLQQLSLALAGEIRKSIERGWDYKLPPISSKN